MRSLSRRDFLADASKTGIALGANLAFGGHMSGQSPAANAGQPIRIYADSRRTLAPVHREVFGSFLEHLGRAIYEGIYDPQSKLSDSNGFRKDVLEEIKKLGVPIVRYPGGNFVSGYNWLDGIGPKANRPSVLDKAWNSINSNEFGTDEFLAWCRLVGTEPLLGLNLGTGTAEQAAALVEYCNLEKGTRWSDLRRKNGIAEPYKVQKWCLGNEMDGPWQIGHMSAAEYGLKAADAARQMRYVDPSLKLVACGSSGPGMPTYLEWDREVLEQCYEYVDAISLHRYFTNAEETGGDSSKFLAMNLSMERQIDEVAAVSDMVRGHKRSPKKLWLSFDEWNVWYRARTGDAVNGHRQGAPHLLEEVYNLEDALLVGGLINSLIRKAERVELACLAQLVNVIAPIMTNANGLLRQTIYYPYSWALEFARGAALELLVESSTYDVSGMGAVSYVDAAGTYQSDTGKIALFLLNRDLAKPHQVEIVWEGSSPRPGDALVLTGNDLKATNTFDTPARVAPQKAEKPSTSGGRTTIELAPRSYTVIEWSI
ncbi:MAG TPA: alpha-N-arabinofuranosidase [Verrucomicrobiae bacterium]|jgi:alpha-N-arabinofuranosidase|nr:alpha-N-arabinofuranosidase [Verrucomicrobiae bacterium]